ncbi:TonB-dependent receptor plug domain-containing protein [Aliikangiella coralliicola]|uniref:TonB-dependent receptor n=1 Tax=Aliikangiella coralliicola TaxID=2592383 RepID=A0A545U4I4_9GAMM|nr:TonB-dependent receptor [Aliikangiella coralliicola]TQV84379.1 TonB-dependent receptor [Aliikangiella coralliicola]
MKDAYTVLCTRFAFASFISLSFLIVINSNPVIADSRVMEVEQLFDLPLEDLLDVKVKSPSQLNTEINMAPSIIAVITESQIKAMGARTLSDVLKMAPGIQLLNRRNGRDMVWIRGIPSGRNTKIMLLIDGVPQREVIFGGWSPDEQVQINNIARIEVIRGPGSALYGGDAYSGLISIYTKEKVPQKTNVTVGVSSFDGQQAKISTGHEFEQAKFLFSARAMDQEGYQQQRDRRGNLSTHDNNVEATSFTAKLLNENWQIAYIYDDYTTEYPLYSSPQYKSQQYRTNSFYLKNNHEWRQVYLENQLYRYQVKRFFDRTIRNADESLNFASFSQLDTQLTGIRSQLTYAFNQQHQGVFGAVYERRAVDEYHETITVRNSLSTLELQSIILRQGDRTPEADNYALYAQTESLFLDNALALTLGARIDHFEEFDNETSPRVALTYQQNDQWSAKLIWGEAFRPPTFLQQYEIRSDGNSPGNPSVTPELIETWETEFVYHFDLKNNLSIRYFESHLNNFIQTIGGAAYENIDKTMQVPGFELEFNGKVKKHWENFHELGLSFNFTRVNTTEASVAKNNANLILFAQDNNKSLYLGINYLDKRNASDLYHTRVTIPEVRAQNNKQSYWILDANIQFKNLWHSSFQLELGIKNVLDKQHYNPTYAPDSYYDVRKEPRSISLNLSYQF